MSKTEKRIAIVDDDHRLVQLVTEAFELEGYQVSGFFDGSIFLRHVATHGLPHLAIIDLHLPSVHGFDVSKKLKALGDVPIVFISNEDEVDTIVDGLRQFADDFVTKPFDIRELLIRVQRILSRVRTFDYLNLPITMVDERLSIDFGKGYLIVDGESVPLTPIEANLLYILIQNVGAVVTSDALIARVWPSEAVFEETLRVHMHRLRRKVELDYRNPRYIQTERGIGYYFVIEKKTEPN